MNPSSSSLAAGTAASESSFDSVLFESMEAASFDSVAWVNRLVAASSTAAEEENGVDDEVLLNAVRSASARLQTRSQELSRDAERIMERMLSVGPRALQELDRVERVSFGHLYQPVKPVAFPVISESQSF